jgi:L-lactate dehydrogenase complex protein LldG
MILLPEMGRRSNFHNAMKESTSKEKVLKKVRDALVERMPAPYQDVDTESDVFAGQKGEFLEESFARAFIRANGKFVFSSDVQELVDNLNALITSSAIKKLYYGEEFLAGLLQSLDVELVNNPKDVFRCDAAVTSCEALIARHGTIVCSSSDKGGRQGIVAAPIHIVFATNKQLVYSIREAIQYIQEKYKSAMPSLLSFLTGPSRTADIEKTLVHGAHGPKELYLFMLDMAEEES